MNNFSYIGYSVDKNIRYDATSGGVGSSIVKYLFQNNEIQTCISFDYDNYSLQYKPKLIHCYDDYINTGSIYHEVDMLLFIKESINNIRGRILMFVLPCQVKPIRHMLDKYNIKSIIIALTCSSQLNIGATNYLLKRLNVNKEQINKIRYRGFGWPSGIYLSLTDNTEVYIRNNNSLWSDIFHSRLFTMNRCFNCKETISNTADIALADPWLRDIINTEKIGLTLIHCNSKLGNKILIAARDHGEIAIDSIEKKIVFDAQRGTIIRKKMYVSHRHFQGVVKKILNNKLYRGIVLGNKNLFKIHCIILRKIENQL